MCKTVENSVDYAENLYFATKIRYFSCICTEIHCGKLLRGSFSYNLL